MKRRKRTCDKEFTKKIIQEAYTEGVREIGFYLIGEPFVYQDFAEIISFCKHLGFSYIYVTTNGALATPERLKSVIDAGLDSIKFSINAASQTSYKKIHGEDDFIQVKNNVEWLRKYLDESGISLKTFISFVKCNYNKDEVNLLYSQFDKLVDKIYVFGCANQGGNMMRLIESGIADELIPNPSPCPMVFNRLHVTVEGYLDACCADSDGMLVVADLHKTSLRDAWYSDVMINLRRQHLTKSFENNLCKCCIQNIYSEVEPLIK
jgi:molybdenum cofactor biosynthesis enzyme MoaA